MTPTREDFLRIQPGPTGMTANGNVMRHVVQQGETLSSIARTYSQHYHLDLDYNDFYNANRDTIVDPNNIAPGQELKFPRILRALIDHRISDLPGMVVFNDRIKHQVQIGDTAASILDQYNSQIGMHTSMDEFLRANAGIIGPKGNVSVHMPALEIPHVNPQDYERQSISDLDQTIGLRRMAKVSDEQGNISTTPVIDMHLNASHARFSGQSLTDARESARRLVLNNKMASAAVVQASDGYWITPLRGVESGGLSDDQRTLKLFISREHGSIASYVQKRPGGDSVKEHVFVQHDADI